MTKSRIPIAIMAVLSVFIAIMSYRFAFLTLALSFPELLGHLEQRPLAFILHISASPIALALGALQFFPRLRSRRPRLHRWIGRIYGVAILVGGASGLVIALGAKGGIAANFGFALLSLLWIGITANAVRLAMAGRIAEHRRWMIRSFALTFAAVTLRLYLLGFMAGGFSYTEASPYLAWMCWVPNLIIAEMIVRRVRTGRDRYRQSL